MSKNRGKVGAILEHPFKRVWKSNFSESYGHEKVMDKKKVHYIHSMIAAMFKYLGKVG